MQDVGLCCNNRLCRRTLASSCVPGQRSQCLTLKQRDRHRGIKTEENHFQCPHEAQQSFACLSLMLLSRWPDWFTPVLRTLHHSSLSAHMWLVYLYRVRTQTHEPAQARKHTYSQRNWGSWRSCEILSPGNFTPMLWAAAVSIRFEMLCRSIRAQSR